MHKSLLRRPIGWAAAVAAAKLAAVAGAIAVLGWTGSGSGVAAVVAGHGAALAVAAALAFLGFRHRGRTETTGGHASLVLHHARAYDLLTAILTLGRGPRLRRQLLALAGVGAGEAMLDVGCGTGTLAIAAAPLVGAGGRVVGIDAAPEMVARAAGKAARARVAARFVVGTAQALPFEDGGFDIVTGTLMLHHLPSSARAAFLREARRVLKPDGRLVLVDFGRRSGPPKAWRLHRHGSVDMAAVARSIAASGFEAVETARVGMMDLDIAIARPARAQANLSAISTVSDGGASCMR